jgi:hypothetical protein
MDQSLQGARRTALDKSLNGVFQGMVGLSRTETPPTLAERLDRLKRLRAAVSDSETRLAQKLKTYGIDGLRIVDASVMPTLIGGNTNAPTIMIRAELRRTDESGRDGWPSRVPQVSKNPPSTVTTLPVM